MNEILGRVRDYLLSRQSSADFEPKSLGAALTRVFILDIERAPGLAAPRLRIRLKGSELDVAFGRPLVGQYLESFIHGPRGDEVIRGFHDCANDRQPLWMRQVVQLKDRAPRFVEGIVVYLAAERIYGALFVGTGALDLKSSFERRPLTLETQR